MQIHPDIQREARKIVYPIVKDLIRSKGYRLSWITTKQLRDAVDAVIANPECNGEFIQRAWDICKIRWERQRV